MVKSLIIIYYKMFRSTLFCVFHFLPLFFLVFGLHPQGDVIQVTRDVGGHGHVRNRGQVQGQSIPEVPQRSSCHLPQSFSYLKLFILS